MIVGRLLCGLTLIALTACAATQHEPDIAPAVDVTPESFPPPPPAVVPTASPTPEEATAIFRAVFDGAAQRSDRIDALEGTAAEDAAILDSGGIVSEVAFDRVEAVAPERVEATGTSLGQPTTVEYIVSDGRWKLERSTACAVTGVC